MADYIPRRDSAFNKWAENFVNYIAPRLEEFGYSPEVFAAVAELSERWDSDLARHLAAQSAARGARGAKDETRAEYTAALRDLVNKVQSNSLVSNEDRKAMGLRLRNDRNGSPISAPDVAPIAHVNGGMRLAHLIKYVSEDKFGVSRAKPHGVFGCEIWMKTGDPPSDPRELQHMGIATRSPHLVYFEGADAGKTAHYMFRWVNLKYEKGPWSETVSATIAG